MCDFHVSSFVAQGTGGNRILMKEGDVTKGAIDDVWTKSREPIGTLEEHEA